MSELDWRNHTNHFDHNALWSSRTSPPSCCGVPQEQVLGLVDEAKTNSFQFQKSSVTDNIQQVAGNYSSSRQSKTKFGWQNGGSLSAQFPTIGHDDKVVLTAVPNIIAASFGTTKPQGDLDSVSVEFCQPRTRFGFWTLHQRHVESKSGQVFYHPSLSVLVYKHSNISSQ